MHLSRTASCVHTSTQRGGGGDRGRGPMGCRIQTRFFIFCYFFLFARLEHRPAGLLDEGFLLFLKNVLLRSALNSSHISICICVYMLYVSVVYMCVCVCVCVCLYVCVYIFFVPQVPRCRLAWTGNGMAGGGRGGRGGGEVR
jgi:hypothetical protein